MAELNVGTLNLIIEADGTAAIVEPGLRAALKSVLIQSSGV